MGSAGPLPPILAHRRNSEHDCPAVLTGTPHFRAGVEWGGVCFAAYSVVCFAFSLALPALARTLGRRHTHSICLACGGSGLLGVLLMHNKYLLLLSMAGVGIAWASTLSMPYAMLAAVLPRQRIGVHMGIFDFFVVVPEMLASLFFGLIISHLLHNNRMYAIAAGGICMLLAALLMQHVRDPQTAERRQHIGKPGACTFRSKRLCQGIQYAIDR